MQLKPLIVTLAVGLTLATGGCVVHFPLADNSPSLQSTDESSSTASTSKDATAPNTNNPIKGNSANQPE
jgi:hypothetical protein